MAPGEPSALQVHSEQDERRPRVHLENGSSYDGNLSTSSSQPPISSELYESIFRYLNKRDLIVLCTVCRATRYEAQRLLYRRIDFIEYQNISGHIVSWSAAIIGCPRLAASVRSLSLPVGIQQALSDTEVRQLEESFPKAVTALVNLAELHIWRVDNPSLRLLPWVLEACTSFRLQKFHIELPRGDFTLSRSLDVMSHQPDLREWAMGFCFGDEENNGTEFVLPSHLLPHLSTVHLRRWKTLSRLVPRPIERMHLSARDPDFADHVGHDMQACPKVFGDLKHLRFELGLVDYVSRWNKAPERLRLISARAPNLKTLSFFDDDVLYGYDVNDLVLSLSEFKSLETFVMDPVEDIVPTPSSYKFDSAAHCLEFAELLMKACPSLQRVAFPVEPYVKRDWMEDGRWAEVDMKGDCPRFVRSATGHARLEGFDYCEDLKSYWKRCD